MIVTRHAWIIASILGAACTAPALAAGAAQAVAPLQIFVTEPLEGAPLPDKLVQLMLPFQDGKNCEKKDFFPKASLTRLDLNDKPSFPLFEPDVDALIKESQTTIQGLFKKTPDIKVIQDKAREHLAKLVIAPEWSQAGSRKSDAVADLGEVVVGSAVLLLMGDSDQKVANVAKTLKGKFAGLVVEAPRDTEAARALMAKALCRDNAAGKSVAVYFVGKKTIALASAKPQGSSSTTSPVAAPQDAVRHFDRAMTFIAQARQNATQAAANYKSAIDELSEAVKLSPEYVDALYNRAVAYMQVKKYNLARDDLLAALKLAPDNPLVHYNLMAWYSLQNQIDLALKELDKTLELGFKEFDALRKDADLKNLRKDGEFRKICEKHKVFLKTIGDRQ